VLIFCFFLFNNKKKARPAGQNQLAGTAKPKSAKRRTGKTKGTPTKQKSGKAISQPCRVLLHDDPT